MTSRPPASSDMPPGATVPRARPAGGTFYGWYIVAGSMTLQAVLGTLFFHGYSAFATFWMSEFGWSRTTVSLAFSLHRTETALLGPLHGWLLQRVSPRRVVALGTLVLGLGFIALSFVQDFLQFVLVFLVMAIGASFCGVLSVMTVLVNWFDRRRTTTLSLMHLGFSLGGLAVPLLAWGLLTFGWRPVAVASGLIILVVGLPIARLMLREPEMVGLRPDGVQATTPPDPTSAGASGQVAEPPPSVRSMLATRAFWLSSIGQAGAIAVGAGVMVHFIVFAHEAVGVSIAVAAALVSLVTATTVLGQLLGGYLGDRYDKRLLSGFSVLGMAVAMILWSYSTTVGMVAAGAIAHGVAGGMRAPLVNALKADLFGRRNFAAVSGFASLITMVGAISGPILIGVLADATGTYRAAFLVLAGIAAASSLAFFLLGPTAAAAARTSLDSPKI